MASYKTEHFSTDELKCRCGCEIPGMDEEFMRKIETLRVEYEKPLGVSSAYRCPEHNSRVSKTGLSGPHTTGQAIDLRVSGEDAFNLIEIALVMGMTGIGVSQKGLHGARFIHLDNLIGNNRPWIWSY